jgi:hypothetical protein
LESATEFEDKVFRSVAGVGFQASADVLVV